MLVLSRKNGESIRVGDQIEITVTQVSGNRVKLAINAPRDVSIRRSELDVVPRAKLAPHGIVSNGCLVLEAIA